MTHPIYSAKYLLRKGISYCKQVAKELGVTPEGDKRQLFTWVEAIVEYQSNIQPIEVEQVEATIDYDDSINGTVEGEYVVKVGGEIVHRTRTYMKAERFIICQGYELVSPQEIAQSEFEAELEAQVEEKEDAPERPRLQILGIDFGYYEFISNSQVVAKITREADLDSWLVNGNGFRLFNYYQDAVEFVEQEFMKHGILLHRGSGRFSDVIEDIDVAIEDSNISNEKGKFFAVLKVGEYGNVLIGYVCLNQQKGWTFDHINYSENWLMPAHQVACATKHEYLLAA